MKVEIKSDLNPTESPEKLSCALKNIFPSADFSCRENLFLAEGDQKIVEHLSSLLEKQRIRDSANVHLRLKAHHGHLKFFLNKQAAFVGKVNFCSDCAMGPIMVEIEGEDLPQFIDRISPRTGGKEDED